ncbi:MAG: nucleotidyltransferase family protein [Lachnospiraceae bacterium]|nr:nucleotidyltransferase family protein [Lachnospiraceae bacterium]
MKCVVLAAGYATRLYPLTENFPKPLLTVGEKPILNWLLDDIDALPEITGHVVISNHKFIEHFESWKERQNYQHPIELLDDGSVDNEHRLGAVKDIQFAIDSLGLQEDLLVIAGDNVLDFSFGEFLVFAKEKGTSCVMCHEENELAKQQKTAIIVRNENALITSYEEKPREPKGNLAVPPFYYYRAVDAARISEALEKGCNADAPGSFAAWLSKQTDVHAWKMTGKRYDIGDLKSYEYVQEVFKSKE